MSGGTLGTFGGVFTPSILTILGLVLFLRVGYVVGSVGIIQSLLILGLATSVSVLTSISLAVVATNMRVRGGGEYFLISRTLGIEFGGAVGVVLYLAISVSIAFYAIGFAEAVVTAFESDSTVLIQLVAAGLVVLLVGVSAIGADLATRLQYLVMVLLAVALLSFFFGAVTDFDAGQFTDNVGGTSSDVGFWEAFAVFFPAVTGFSQGVAMSGDLRDPSRSITRGTFTAVGFSTVVYLAVIVLLGGLATSETLVSETTTIMGDFSIVEGTMLVGVLAATLSSTLASALGGPRVLQRLGEDRVLPRLEFFAVGSGATNNPRRALGLSAIIALITVAAGDLNAIAPVISMFFLASYGLINYATFYEIQAGSTSFRPRFRWFDARLSLLGTVACAGSIIAINPVAGAFAGLIFAGLFSYLRNRETPDRWVDSSGSYHYTRARHHMQALHDEPAGRRDWRPCILGFVPRDPSSRRRMITIASWLEGDSGYLTAVRIVEGTGPVLRRKVAGIEDDLETEIDEAAPGSFARVLMVRDTQVGVQTLVQSHGLGDVRANLAVFGVRDLRGTDTEQEIYGQMLQSCVRFGANVAILNVRDDAWERFEATPPDQRSIALWWSDDQVGQLITLLGWLCQRHEQWDQASIVVYVPHSDSPDEAGRVEGVLEAARISATVVEVDETPAAFTDALSGSTMALAPLRIRRGRAIGPFETPLGMLVESLPLAVMVLATESVELDAEADDGALAEFAKATDQAESAQKWVSELDEKAAILLVDAETKRQQLDNVISADDIEMIAPLEEEVRVAEFAAAQAYRKYVDAKSRCRILEQRAEELDPSRYNVNVDPTIWRSSSISTERA